jgi:hypothetical protein
MNQDLSTFELALLRTEADITDADDDMARMEKDIIRTRAQIARRAKERDGFVDLLNKLKVRLGREVPEEASSGGDEDAIVSMVGKNDFKSMSPAPAARKFLLKVGRGVSHPILVKALQRGNVKCGSRSQTDAIRTALGRTKGFVFIKATKGSRQRGKWILEEWQIADEEPNSEGNRLATAPPALSLVGQASVAVQK